MQYLFFVRVQKQWGEEKGEEICFSAPLHINATTACGVEGGRKFSSFSRADTIWRTQSFLRVRRLKEGKVAQSKQGILTAPIESSNIVAEVNVAIYPSEPIRSGGQH